MKYVDSARFALECLIKVFVINTKQSVLPSPVALTRTESRFANSEGKPKPGGPIGQSLEISFISSEFASNVVLDISIFASEIDCCSRSHAETLMAHAYLLKVFLHFERSTLLLGLKMGTVDFNYPIGIRHHVWLIFKSNALFHFHGASSIGNSQWRFCRNKLN